MDHFKVMGFKFVAIFATVLALYGIFDEVNLWSIVLISLFTTVIAYIVGDQMIYRKFGNVVASFSDFVLAFVTLWLLGNMFLADGVPVATVSLISAIFIACVEPFVHSYMAMRFPEMRSDRRMLNMVQTEFSEETDVSDDIKRKQDERDNDNEDEKDKD